MPMPKLPRRPIRSLFRFAWHVIAEIFRVWLDLGDPKPREPAKPRPAREVRRGRPH